MRGFSIGFLFILFSLKSVIAYNEVDSLRMELLTTMDQEEKLKLNLELSYLYYDINIDSALIFGNTAYELSKQVGDFDQRMTNTFNLATILFSQSDYQGALEYYFDLLSVMDTAHYRDNYFGLLFNIGLVFQSLGNKEKAEKYYSQAIAIVNTDLSKKDTSEYYYRRLVGRAYNNIGIMFSENGDFSEAFAYYDSAEQAAIYFNTSAPLPRVYNNRARIYQVEEQFDSAFYFYRKAYYYQKQNGSLNDVARSYYYLGDCYKESQVFDSALYFLHLGLELAQSPPDLGLQLDLTEALANVYRQQGKYKLALEQQLWAKALQDSMNIEEEASLSSMLEMQYKFNKYKADQAYLTQKRKMRNTLVIGLLGTGVLISLLLILLLRSKVKQAQLKREKVEQEKLLLKQTLESKNKELATNIMYLVSKNELINYVSENLMKHRTNFKKNNLEFIQDIIVKLKQNVDENMWQEFELRFKEVNEEFYKILIKRFPNLSNNERRLCAFLKLDMSTKEISAITQQAPHTINIARSRLRKKLGLENSEENISNFLMHLKN